MSKGEHHRGLTCVGLFAGIGGIELGFRLAGGHAELLCEIDEGASRVLQERFPDVPLNRDIRELRSIPSVDVLAAGFPCQDLSQAGRTAGIRGKQSGLIHHVFRLLNRGARAPKWLLLENVPFMLQLERGRAMRYLVDELEELENHGFTWAYRVIDALAFGLPQRRQRVILIASRTEDPRPMLFASSHPEQVKPFSRSLLCGFYWTEGLRGLGWGVDCVPTLKGGSGLGIPSPPAIWNPADGSFVTPDIRDAERLQGFPVDWTLPATSRPQIKPGHRWKLVGNAVSVPVGRWVAERLHGGSGTTLGWKENGVLPRGVAWPRAAWGHKGKVYAVECSRWPVAVAGPHLVDFLKYPTAPLSARAAAGFYSRAKIARLRFEDGFLESMQRYVEATRRQAVA